MKCVNESKCFSTTADETTDISGIEKLTLGVRYVQTIVKFPKKEHKIREDFLRFIPVVDVTGAGLAKTILKNLEEIKVDTNFMKGQGKFVNIV